MNDQPTTPRRLVSLDALRGFDMFWILGAEGLAEALHEADQAPWAQFVSTQLMHVEWAGFRFLDLIFPLFVFIAGASLVFSLTKAIETHGRGYAVRKLIVRAVVLHIIGLIYYGGISDGIENIRWVGVLQRIAIAYLFAGLLFCCTSTIVRAVVTVLILVGYWALVCFVAPPGGEVDLTQAGPEHNIVNWFDYQYLPGFKWDGTHDPEGVLSNLPAIATCLLGVFAGQLLRRQDLSHGRKIFLLLTGGVALAAAGWAWDFHFPVIKKLWTSSYVLVAGGYSCLLLAAFYAVIDAIGWKTWAAPFIWIGMNPITLYVLFEFVRYRDVVEALVGGPIALACTPYNEVLIHSVVLLLNVALAWLLYSKRVFLKV